MASLDFPASPTTGQLFSAANGVTYMYNGTLWLVQAGPGGGTGDFCAINTASPVISTALALMTGIPVVTGNSGAWYNSATGRYTPPAGRYVLRAQGYGYGPNAGYYELQLRKNGSTTPIQRGQTQAVAATSCFMAAEIIVDTNGSDYFELWAISSGGSGTLTNATFQSFPLTGMQGPMGPPFGGGTGDFFAVNTSAQTVTTTPTVCAFPSVLTGNAGGWFNTSNNRYTPPAGRFFIYGQTYAYNPPADASLAFELRKNGVMVARTSPTGLNTRAVQPYVSGQFDTNGSDYFELVQSIGAGTATGGGAASCFFGAYPLTGMQGPQGAPPTAGGGIIREVTLASPAATIDLFSLGVKSVQLIFQMQPVTDNTTLLLRVASGSTPIGTATYSPLSTQSSGTTVSTATLFGQAYFDMGNAVGNAAGGGIFGTVMIPLLNGSVASFRATAQTHWFTSGGAYVSKDHRLSTNNACDGVQLLFLSGNIAAGSFVRVIGWP